MCGEHMKGQGKVCDQTWWTAPPATPGPSSSLSTARLDDKLASYVGAMIVIYCCNGSRVWMAFQTQVSLGNTKCHALYDG